MKELISVIGTPYRDKGRGPDAYDCYGLFIYVNKLLFNRDIPDHTDYENSMDAATVTRSIEEHKKQWQEIEKGQEQAGDAIILTIAGMPVHIGIILGNHTMLHTLPGRNACIENYETVMWKKRIQGIFRWMK